MNREAAARYGLRVGDVNDIIESAIGGKTIATTVEGRERYPINVRYARDFREDLDALKRVLVPTPTGAQVPISLLADISYLGMNMTGMVMNSGATITRTDTPGRYRVEVPPTW